MVSPTAGSILRERLIIEHMRQLWASEDDPTMIHRAAIQANAQIVFIDSSKDLAGGPLKDEGPAKALMDAIQICIANNIDVAMLHHPRKAGQDTGTKRELSLDDVYGSAWLTAGAGSVLLVDGKPGTGEFKFEQLKAPATFIDPCEIAVNYETGELKHNTIRDVETWLKTWGMAATIKEAVMHQYGIPEEDINYESTQYRKMRDRLERLVAQGVVGKTQTNPRKYQWSGPMLAVVKDPK
jgi:replicative DNA helicase